MKFPGETDIVINGKSYTLRLTLGALAEIENAFGGDFSALSERFKTPRIADLLLVLYALIRGGGADMTLDLLKASDVDFNAAAKAIGEAFRAFDPAHMEAPEKKSAAAFPGENGSPQGSSSCA
jgi:hypothetical protein